MGDFRRLRAWQEAVALAVRSRDAIAKLPSVERFALGDQWRRAAYSVALNIAWRWPKLSDTWRSRISRPSGLRVTTAGKWSTGYCARWAGSEPLAVPFVQRSVVASGNAFQALDILIFQ